MTALILAATTACVTSLANPSTIASDQTPSFLNSKFWAIAPGGMAEEDIFLRNDAVIGKQLKGLGGSSFISTYRGNPRTSVNLVSQAFKIKGGSPFLNLRVAGGHDVDHLRINIRIGGKVIRSKTGPGTLTFDRMCFDLSHYIDEEVQVEIEDTSLDRVWGYIFVTGLALEDHPDTPDQDFLLSIIGPARDRYHMPGIVSGISLDGEIVACTALGVRKLGDDQRIKLTDPVLIGSISKTLTGTVVAKAVRDGKISWNDTFDKCLPSLASGTSNPVVHASLQNFMTYTSGLPSRGHGTFYFDGITDGDLLKVSSNSEFRKLLIVSELKLPADCEPGTKEVYSGGATYAAQMVEAKTGVLFDLALKKVLIDDFGLKSLHWGDDGNDNEFPTGPRGHELNEDGRFIKFGGNPNGPGGWKFRALLTGGGAISCLDVLRYGGILATGLVPGHPDYDKRFFDDTFVKRLDVSDRSNTGWRVDGPNILHAGMVRADTSALAINRSARAAVFVYTNMAFTSGKYFLNDVSNPLLSYVSKR